MKLYSNTRLKDVMILTKNLFVIKDKYKTYLNNPTSYYWKVRGSKSSIFTRWNILNNYYYENKTVDIFDIELCEDNITDLVLDE